MPAVAHHLKDAPTSRHSLLSLQETHKRLQTTFNKSWNAAPRSSVFLTKPQTVTNDKGKKVLKLRFSKLANKEIPVPQRRRRRCGKTPIATLLSGAVACVAKQLEAETQPFKVKNFSEKKNAPAMPAPTAGAELLMEHLVSEYAAAIFATAKNIQTSFKKTKNVSPSDIRAAAELLNDDIAAATSMAPGSVLVLPETRKQKKAVAAAAEGGEAAEAAEAPESGEGGGSEEASAVA